MVDIRKDIAKFLQQNNIPVDVSPKKDIMDKTEVKASDILLGKTEDKQVNKMSDIFPSSGAENNPNNFLS